MIAQSGNRVELNTDAAVNRKNQRLIATSLAYFAKHRHEIQLRLNELDREWDVERVLETGSASLTLLGLVGGITSSRKWYVLALVVQGFFLHHALQGWCPTLPLLRNLGVRTRSEIDQERAALKALRGDYDHLPNNPDTAARPQGDNGGGQGSRKLQPQTAPHSL